METKKNMNNPKSAATEVRNGMKSIWLFREIKKELETGAALEDVVARYVPTLEEGQILSDMNQMQMGIESLYDSARQTGNYEWIRQRLTDALSELDTRRRALYLCNLLKAVAAAYPESVTDAGTEELLKEMDAAQEYTQESVDALLDKVSALMPQIGEMFQRSCMKAMLGRMDKLDHEKIAGRLEDGKASVTAYAAACYILQKRGRSLGQIDGNMTAYSLGAAAAAGLESSRLVELYYRGKLSAQELAGKLKNLFTAAATCVSEGLIRGLALGMCVFAVVVLAEVFFQIFVSLGAFLFFSPFWLILGCALLAAGAVGAVATVDDCEELIHRAWEQIKAFWDKIVAAWPGKDASAEAEDAPEWDSEAETEEDEEEAESEEEESESEDAEDEETESEGEDNGEGAFA